MRIPARYSQKVFTWRGRGYVIKAPWMYALFSERNGHWPHRRFLGFRIGLADRSEWQK